MAWEAVDFDPFAEDEEQVDPAASGTDPVLAPGEAGPAAQAAPVPSEAEGIWGTVKSAFTGEGRTEFPEAGEFRGENLESILSPEGRRAMHAMTFGRSAEDLAGRFSPQAIQEAEAYRSGNKSVLTSSVSPDPEAQFDILKKAIPGLERRQDKYGNIMLKAPGMKEFTYLNKPGTSLRDVEEFATATAVTAPFLGFAGGGASVPARIFRGGLGLTGASVEQDLLADAAGSEQGIDPTRAAISGGLGAGIPALGAVGRGIVGGITGLAERTTRPIRSAINPRGEAERELRGAFQADFRRGGLRPERAAQPADAATAAQRGQDLRTMDYGGETVKAQARKAANISPAARDSIMRVIGPRAEGQTARAQGVIQGELGLGNSSEVMRDQLRQQARQARAPLYHQSYTQGAGGLDSPILRRIEQSPLVQRAMRRADQTIRDQAATSGFTTGRVGRVGQVGGQNRNFFTLEYWDQVKQALDDYAGSAFRDGANRRGAQASTLARELRQELDRHVPLYRQARGVAQGFFEAEDALDAGRNFASGRFNLDDSRQAIQTMTAPERNLFAEGFADEFLQQVRSVSDRSSLLNRIMQSPQERDRVLLALGQQRYNQLESFLRIEGIMDMARQAMGNSTTARQLVELGATYGAPAFGGALSLSSGDPTAAIIGVLISGGRMAGSSINRRVAEQMAELLTSTNPQAFLTGLQQVSRGPILDALRAFDNALAASGPAAPALIQQAIRAGSYQPEPENATAP